MSHHQFPRPKSQVLYKSGTETTTPGSLDPSGALLLYSSTCVQRGDHRHWTHTLVVIEVTRVSRLSKETKHVKDTYERLVKRSPHKKNN